MQIIFHIEGGLGKHIMATAILKVIKREHPQDKIYIVCAYPDVFKNNPMVNRVFNINNHGQFYKDYIKDNEDNTKILYSDPYTHSDFILNKKHLLKIWCEQWDLEYKNETPEIFLTQAEEDYYKPFYKTEKPILVIQPNGGPPSQGFNYSWTRDIPESTVLNIINHFKKSHTIIHIKRQDQKIYPDTLQALDDFRSIAILLQLSDKRLLIDSFSQHLAASLNLKSTVCWVTTQPDIFGYTLHDNILANQPDLQSDFTNNLYQPFELAQDISSCPYTNIDNILNDQEIINSLNT